MKRLDPINKILKYMQEDILEQAKKFGQDHLVQHYHEI